MGDHAVLDAERAFVLQEHDLVAGSKVASTILGSEPIAFADNTPLDEGGTRQFVERTNVTTQMRQNECRFGRIVIAGPVSDQRGDGIRLERETTRLTTLTPSPISRQCSWTQFEPAVAIGVCALILSGIFALRVAVKGNAAFATSEPKRIRGRRALYGDADWMSMQEAAKLFPESGGIVIGERMRVDKDSVSAMAFRAADRETWGQGGKTPLLAFDASFGSSHDIVFAGSGGFKTTSPPAIPTFSSIST